MRAIQYSCCRHVKLVMQSPQIVLFIVYKEKNEGIIQQVFLYHHMYLGTQPIFQPHSSVLHLTGQLTIMAHQQHPQHPQHVPYAYNMPTYEQATHPQHPPQTVRSPLHTQFTEYPPPFQANQSLQHRQQEHPRQPQQRPPSQAREHSEKVEDVNPRQTGLEVRVEHLEKMCSSIIKVNAQTLETFRDIRDELIHRITAHDEVSMEKIKNLEEIGHQSERKSQELLQKQEKRLKDEEKRLKEEEKKLEIKRQELQSMMRDKMKELLEQEKVQAEKLRKEQFQQLTQEMDRLYKTSTEDKMQTMAEKMKEMEDKREQLEERVQLKIKEEVKRLSALLKEAEERSQGEIQSLKSQLREKETREAAKEEEQRAIREVPEKYVMPTPNAKCSTINQNTITRSSGDNSMYKMVLLDIVVGEGVFSFRIHIHNKKGHMWIGVADRVTQKERDWAQHEHSIKYRDNGTIYYATGDGKKSCDGDGTVLKDGMELLCEVEREKCQVTFTVFEGGLRRNSRQVHSPILCQPHRQFVPCFEMKQIGDRISWDLQ